MGKTKRIVPKGWGASIRKMKSNFRTYRERPTPSNHAGILERKPDFIYRIRRKQQREAEEKYYEKLVENRNDDEYHPDMKHAYKDWKSGKTVIKEYEKLEEHIQKKQNRKMIKNTSNQNINLLRTKLSIVQSQLRRLKNELQLHQDTINVVKPNKHIFFVKKKKKLKTFKPESHFSPGESSVQHESSTSKGSKPVGGVNPKRRKFEKLLKREEFLKDAIREIEMALNVSMNRDEVEQYYYYEDKDDEDGAKNAGESRILVGDLKNVKFVKFKDERRK